MSDKKAGNTKAKAGESYADKSKENDVRTGNIIAAKSVADAVRTSLGPRGMDKMVTTNTGEVLITNDGATIMKQMEVTHPAAKMLVELSKSQDVEAGDGTTSVVVIAGALLQACQQLLGKGIHPTSISDAFAVALRQAEEVLHGMSIPIELSDRDSLLRSAVTSLNSKVVSQNSALLAPMAVDAVMRVIDPAVADNVDLRNIRIVKKPGGTVDDSELVDGLIFNQKGASTGPTTVKDAKILLIQFCLSPPKTDLENSVVISEYQQMDRVLKEERAYLLKLCKEVASTGANVLLIQKSILRDAVTELSLHFLAKLKIMVIKDIERDEIEFVSKTLGVTPVASPDMLKAEKLGRAELVSTVATGTSKIVKVTGIAAASKTVSILIRGVNQMMVDEAERSLHDALCVIRCLVKKKFLITGGGSAEIELAYRLSQYAKTLHGRESLCVRAYAEALEVIPSTLAENAGLHPINIVTELRNRHAARDSGKPEDAEAQYTGINVKKGTITGMRQENVVQPLLVFLSSLTLATETVRMILKIDDLVYTV